MNAHLDDYYCFAQVVEHGGFNAAERATHIAKSKLSRRVLNLEEFLGVRLIQRNSRQFTVTEMGFKIYEQAKIMLNAAQTAQDLVHQLSETPRGVVRMSVPTSIAQNELAHILPKFLQRYPDVNVQLLISNRRYDIIHENIDIALRVRSQLDQDAGLIIRHFDTHQQHLCASPQYLQSMASIQHPQDLAQHRILSLQEQHPICDLELYSIHGEQCKVSVQPILAGFDLSLLHQLAVEHCGITLLPDSISQKAIQTGELCYVLPDWYAPHGIFHMVYPSRKGILPAVKVMIDFLVEQLQIKQDE
ncbi:MAG: LysR family transcriptional regulator [Acinetobacter sp.]|nr:LysR family transcriptional regulator [Acinetobacter sp.]